MKTRCAYCGFLFKAPDLYKGSAVKCPKCGKKFAAAEYHRPPIIVPADALPATGNFLTKLWSKSPTPFKTAFFATLGVTAALVLSLYAYIHLFIQSPIQASAHSDIIVAKKQLAMYGLFPAQVGSYLDILRGRSLRRYIFSPDVTKPSPSLSIWLDERSQMVGVSAYWQGNRWGMPIDVNDEGRTRFRNGAVRAGFQVLTDFDMNSLAAAPFYKHEGRERFYPLPGRWQIDFARHDKGLLLDPTEKHKAECELCAITYEGDVNKANYNLFDFSAIAINW